MSSDNIKVVVRARPLKKSNNFVPWIIDAKTIYQIDEGGTSIGDKYTYDEVFDMNTKNCDIYQTSISSLVNSAIEGINLTIFAYGATSSGKTYTMNGTQSDPGIIPRFIEDIFDKLESCNHRKFLMSVSYVEIYSEIINDLLDKNNKDLRIREGINNCVSYNPTEKIVKSCSECMDVIKLGSCNRTTGETNMNLFSSRSHSIFRIVIESAAITGDANDPVQVSHVNLIDLAGSERVSQTGATGQRFKEGAHINKSLTVLGMVIKQLVEKNEYINYRDSKLTRILSNSLGGNAKTLIICNINLESLEDTASTLMFAQRAKAVKNKPKVNEIITEAALTKRYAQECSEVKKLLDVEFEKNKKLEEERKMSLQKIEELRTRIRSYEEIFVRKQTKVKPPRRRYTIGTLDAISEERELGKTPKQLVTLGPRGDEIQSLTFENEYSLTSTNNSSFRDCKIEKSVCLTPPRYLRDRLEILTREHQEIVEFTRAEEQISTETITTLNQLQCENQDLKMLVEAKDEELKSEQKKTEQIRIDYEFLLENQKKKFKSRENELLEQLNRSLNRPIAASMENVPIPKPVISTFEYEEISEKNFNLQQQNDELHSILRKIEMEKIELNKSISDLSTRFNSLELQNSQLKIKNKSLQCKMLDMEVRASAANSSSDCVQSLKKKIEEYEIKIQELKTENDRVENMLFEAQDKLLCITQDLDNEEKKSSKLENQLQNEKIFRGELESKLVSEIKLREQLELKLDEEMKLRQEIVEKSVEEIQTELGNNQKSISTSNNIEENISASEETEKTFSKLDERYDSEDFPIRINQEIELSEKIKSDLLEEKQLTKLLEKKLHEEWKMRRETLMKLCILKNILNSRLQEPYKKRTSIADIQNEYKSNLDISSLEQSFKSTEESVFDDNSEQSSSLCSDLINSCHSIVSNNDQVLFMNEDTPCKDAETRTDFKLKKMNNDLISVESEKQILETQFEENKTVEMYNIEKCFKDKEPFENEKADNILTIGKPTERMIDYQEKTNHLRNSNDRSENEIYLFTDVKENQLFEKDREESHSPEESETNNELLNNIQNLETECKRISCLFNGNNSVIIEKTEENDRVIMKKGCEHGNLLEEQQLKLDLSASEKMKSSNIFLNLQNLELKYEKLCSLLKEKEKIVAELIEDKCNLEKDKHNLSIKVKDLQLEIGESVKKINDLSKAVENNEVLAQRVCEENKNLKKQMELIKSDNDSLKKIKDQEENEKLNVERMRSILIKEKEELEKDKDQTQQLLMEEKDKNLGLLVELQNLQIQNKKLSSLLDENDRTLLKLECEKKYWTEEKKNLCMKTEEVLKENEKLLHDIDDFKVQVSNLSSTIDKNRATISDLTTEKMILKEMNNSLSNKMDDLLEQMNEKSNQKEELELIYNNLLKQKENLENEYEKQLEMLNVERENNKSFINNIQNLQIKYNELFSSLEESKSIIEKLKNEKVVLEMERNTKAEELFKENEKLKFFVENQNENINNLTEEISELCHQVTELRKSNEEHMVKVRELNKSLKNKDLRLQQLEIENRKIKELQEKNIEKEKEIDLLKKSNNKLFDNICLLGDQKLKFQSEIDDMKHEIKMKISESIVRMKAAFNIPEEKTFRTAFRPITLKTRLEELQKIEKLVLDLVKEKEVHSDCEKKLRNIEQDNKKLESDNQSLKDEINFFRKAIERMKRAQEKMTSDYDNQLKFVNQQLKTIYGAHEEDKKKIKNLEYELQTVSMKCRTGSYFNQHSEKSIHELKTPEDKWKQQRNKAHDSRRSIDLNSLCSESRVDLCISCTEMKTEMDQMKEDLELLRSKYSKMKLLCRIRNEEIQQLKKN